MSDINAIIEENEINALEENPEVSVATEEVAIEATTDETQIEAVIEETQISVVLSGGNYVIAENIGDGSEVYKEKDGITLKFRTLTSGDNITLTENENEIKVEAIIPSETDPIYEADKSLIALKSNVLELDNTSEFTPNADYEPATKKYVDDSVSAEDHWNIVDTKANILATTPTEGNAGFASDTSEIFVADGTNWRNVVLPLGTALSGNDIGTYDYSETLGYYLKTINDKLLVNSTIGDYNNSYIKEGSLRRNTTTNKVQVYLDSEWRNIVTMIQEKEDDIFFYSQERIWSDIEVDGHMIMQFGRIDIGAYPSDYILDGGTL